MGSVLSQQEKANENTWDHLVWTVVIREGRETTVMRKVMSSCTNPRPSRIAIEQGRKAGVSRVEKACCHLCVATVHKRCPPPET